MVFHSHDWQTRRDATAEEARRIRVALADAIGANDESAWIAALERGEQVLLDDGTAWYELGRSRREMQMERPYLFGEIFSRAIEKRPGFAVRVDRRLRTGVLPLILRAKGLADVPLQNMLNVLAWPDDAEASDIAIANAAEGVNAFFAEKTTARGSDAMRAIAQRGVDAFNARMAGRGGVAADLSRGTGIR